MQLKSAMTERMEEIRIHKDLLQRQLRMAEDDKSEATRELNERIERIDQLKKRYEIIIMSMEGNEDGQLKTHAYYVVKHAQEREQLQQRGDELDQAIKKQEREVRALDNTLRMMDGRNNKMKDSQKKMDESSAEVQQKNKLQAQYQTALDRCKHKRRELNELQQELESLQGALALAQQEEDAVRKQLESAETAAAIVDRELAEQQVSGWRVVVPQSHSSMTIFFLFCSVLLSITQAKIQRAVTQVQQLVKKHREAAGAHGGNETLEELDFEYRQLRDFNQRIMQDIEALVKAHPEIAPQVQLMYERSGIKFSAPSAPGSRGSSLAAVSV